MSVPAESYEQRVTPLELFFDLVFVFAITRVTALMAHDLSWASMGRGLLVLAALWWGWAAYAWLTNHVSGEDGRARVVVFVAMAAMVLVALAVPEAFDAHALLFALAYMVMRMAHLALYWVSSLEDPDVHVAVGKLFPTAITGPLILVAAAFADGALQAALWIVALALDYGGPYVRGVAGYRVHPAHFAERFSLIVIIALGESIVAIGVAAAGAALTLELITAGVLGLAVIAALWWAYFDVIAVLAQRQLTELSGVARARLARDGYSYLHMPMIAGIVLFALGLKITAHDAMDPLGLIPAAALCGGPSLYFFSHVAARVRLVYELRRTTTQRVGWIGPGRLAAAIGTLALIPAAVALPALAVLALLAALCWALIVWDVRHYRAHRVEVRQERP
jgi:low temperature requirement protein LtrA